MSLYRNILSQAWKTTWRYKYLWFFGLFAALLGNGGEYEILVRGFNGETGTAALPAWRQIAKTGVFKQETLNNISGIMRDDPFSLLMLILIGLTILCLTAFLIWLSVASQASLVNNAAAHLSGKKADFKSGLSAIAQKFWPVLGLNVLNKIIILAAFVLIGLPVVLAAARSENAGINLLYIIIFVVLMAAVMALSFIMKYAIAYVVIKGNKFAEAIKSGWRLFVENWLISLEMAFMLFAINFLFGLVLALAVLILAVPFLFSALLLYKLASVVGFWLVAIVAFVLFLAIILTGGAILSTFQISSWTGLFVELVNKGGVSKIVRLVEEWKSNDK